MPAGWLLAAAPTLSASEWVPRSALAPLLLLGGRCRLSEDLAWRKPNLVGKTSWSDWCDSCQGGSSTRSEDLTRLHRHGARAGAGSAARAPRAQFDLHRAGKRWAEPGGEGGERRNPVLCG